MNTGKLISYINAIKLLQSEEKFHISLGLERIIKTLELFGSPQDSLKIVHVAGTNGKGSTCAMLSSVLRECGRKTGMYTSPHLINYTERIKINGQDISQEDFASLFFEIHNTASKNEIPLTEFEILTAMAFLYFKKENVDIVILETGLGGRLDATNVVKNPLLSIVTSIDKDHVDRLGDTIEKIAYEKAGIIKAGMPVVTSSDNKGIEVIKNKAKELKSPVFLANENIEITFDRQNRKNIVKIKDDSYVGEYELSMLGFWQAKNLSLVLEALKILDNSGIKIDTDSIKTGLKNALWPARMHYIKEHNLLIDGAHNPSAAGLLRESLDYYFPDKQITWIYGSIATKDYKSITKILFKEDETVICTTGSFINSVNADELKEHILQQNTAIKVSVNANVKKCVDHFLNRKNDNCLTVVAGSLYLAGDVLTLLNNLNN